MDCFCNAFAFLLLKIWEKAMTIWLENYHLKGLGSIVFKFQICGTNIHWYNRRFMLERCYPLWSEPHSIIATPVFLILHRWKFNVNNLFIVVFHLKNGYKWPLNLGIRYEPEIWRISIHYLLLFPVSFVLCKFYFFALFVLTMFDFVEWRVQYG